MKPKTITLDGVEFRLNPLKPRQVMRITKNVVQLIGAGMKDGTKQQLMAAISEGLSSMSDSDFEELSLLMFKTTQAITKDGPIEIKDGDDFDKAFMGVNPENIYVLMYEVLVYNRFPLVRDLDLNIGELIETIELSVKDEMQTEDKKTNTENQENSSET